MTHDYVRHGTTGLFAALDVSSGSVIAEHHRRHPHQEFLHSLKTIDHAVPADLNLHLICDTTAPTRPPRSKSGSCATRASTYTSPPPAAHGSTSSNAGLPN
jgi:hypothetical protein